MSDWVYSGVFRDVYGEFMIQVNEEYLGFRGEKSQTPWLSAGGVSHSQRTVISGGKCLPSVGNGATSAQLARETSSGGQKRIRFSSFFPHLIALWGSCSPRPPC